MVAVQVVFATKPTHDVTHELISSAFRAAQTKLVGQLGAARLQWEVVEVKQEETETCWRAEMRWLTEKEEKEDVVLFRNALSLISLVGNSYCRVDWLG